jgi:hypothetical protein
MFTSTSALVPFSLLDDSAHRRGQMRPVTLNPVEGAGR